MSLFRFCLAVALPLTLLVGCHPKLKGEARMLPKDGPGTGNETNWGIDPNGPGGSRTGGPGSGSLTDLDRNPGGYDPSKGSSGEDMFGKPSDIGLSIPVPPGEGEGVLRMFGPVYFANDQSNIGEAERPKLDAIAAYLTSDKGIAMKLIVEGHCDERGSEEYNRALGERRAIAAKDYLLSKQIDASRISTMSYGEEQPADPGLTEEAFAKNRRAEFAMVPLNGGL